MVFSIEHGCDFHSWQLVGHCSGPIKVPAADMKYQTQSQHNDSRARRAQTRCWRKPMSTTLNETSLKQTTFLIRDDTFCVNLFGLTFFDRFCSELGRPQLPHIAISVRQEHAVQSGKPRSRDHSGQAVRIIWTILATSTTLRLPSINLLSQYCLSRMFALDPYRSDRRSDHWPPSVLRHSVVQGSDRAVFQASASQPWSSYTMTLPPPHQAFVCYGPWCISFSTTLSNTFAI